MELELSIELIKKKKKSDNGSKKLLIRKAELAGDLRSEILEGSKRREVYLDF